MWDLQADGSRVPEGALGTGVASPKLWWRIWEVAFPLQIPVLLLVEQRRWARKHGGGPPAPVVIIPPRSVHNVTGAQVYLSCEVRAVPTPVITWRKVTQSPEGTRVLEDLPGDHVNIAVQVRGGPSDHEATAWILINPLRKEDEGVYLCHSANAVGEAQSQGTVTVIDLSKYNAPRLPAPDDRM
eukprot:XP_005627047.1 insulin-like growth factor-binding protein-like 1 [Canis lupus familiaris]